MGSSTEMYKPNLESRVGASGGVWRNVLLYASLAAGVLGYNARANADCPNGDPMNDVPSTPTLAIPAFGKPGSLGLVGGYGHNGSAIWGVLDNSGQVWEYNGISDTPFRGPLNAWVNNATGIGKTPTGVRISKGDLVFNLDTNFDQMGDPIYIGNINATSVAWGMGIYDPRKILATTSAHSIGAIAEDGAYTQIGGGIPSGFGSLTVLRFKPDTYCNNLIVYDKTFQRIDANGDSLNSPNPVTKTPNFGSGTPVAAFPIDGAWVNVYQNQIRIFQPFPLQQHLEAVEAPEDPVVLGDMDCDLEVTVNDIQPFAAALISEEMYSSFNLDCNIERADMNQDGQRNGLDVQLFANSLTGNN